MERTREITRLHHQREARASEIATALSGWHMAQSWPSSETARRSRSPVRLRPSQGAW